jgi:hypothetical protein
VAAASQEAISRSLVGPAAQSKAVTATCGPELSPLRSRTPLGAAGSPLSFLLPFEGYITGDRVEPREPQSPASVSRAGLWQWSRRQSIGSTRHPDRAKRAPDAPSGGRRLERDRCTRARPLFREPGSVSGAGGSRTRRRQAGSDRPIAFQQKSLQPKGPRDCYPGCNPLTAKRRNPTERPAWRISARGAPWQLRHLNVLDGAIGS